MIDHASILVSDFERSRSFYLGALAPLGYELVMEFSREQIPDLPAVRIAGLGANRKPDLWLVRHEGPAPLATHLAFGAAGREQVDAFYQAALAAGGRSNGEPGVRSQYHPHYYGAFVLDPDGHNIEAVCHSPAP
jgi:catechol 2,3-dioxygenase-like lactoylglutathione lyase family enzyme